MRWNEPKTLEEAVQLCQIVIKSGLIPGIQNVDQAVAIALAGADLGMGLMSSLRAFHVMSGRAVMASQTLVAIAQRSNECVSFHCVETTDTGATYEAQRRGGTPVRRSFTIADAERAGLLRNPTWRRYPKAMLRWRCAASLTRDLFADVIGGFVDLADNDFEGQAAPVRTIPTKLPPVVIETAEARELKKETTQRYLQGLGENETWQEAARAAVGLMVEAEVFANEEAARVALAGEIKALGQEPSAEDIAAICAKLDIEHRKFEPKAQAA